MPANKTLPIAILAGIAGYFIYTAIPALDATHQAVLRIVSILQPVLIFSMLFITFCKVRLRDFKHARWHWPLLLMQTGIFVVGTVLVSQVSNLQFQISNFGIVAESFLLCIICPTATAAVVVTTKLGGNAGTLTTYTMLINIAVAVAVPAMVPLMHPDASTTFLSSFLIIIIKVFPLLIGPLLLAILMRAVWPWLTRRIASVPDLAFYLWAVSLALAIAVSVKALVHSRSPLSVLVGIAVASALACVMQFAFGHWVGRRCSDTVSAAQACGQKNTVFAIWLGYTFLTPVTALAGGFYSIWHNVYNSWQLRDTSNSKEKK